MNITYGGKRMKSLIKKISLLVVMLLATNTAVYANEFNNTGATTSKINLESKSEDVLIPNSDGYYYWQIDSKIPIGYTYGSWSYGDSAWGPSTLTRSETVTYTNTISGSFTSKSAIEASFGITIGVTYPDTTSFSLHIPAGEHWIMKYRASYTQYQVIENQYYRIDGYSTKTGAQKISYVNKYTGMDWGYDDLN